MAIHYDKTSSEIPDHVVPISIDRPEIENALDLDHFRDLDEACEFERKIANPVFQTEHAKEGPRAFAEARAPIWRAR